MNRALSPLYAAVAPTRRSCLNALTVAMLTVVSLAVPRDVLAIDIVLSYSGGFENRPAAVRAMEQAAAMWEFVLVDPIDIQIDVREVPLAELFFTPGGSIENTYQAPWPLVRELLTADAISADDRSSVAHLSPGPQLRLKTWDPDMNAITNDGNDAINNRIFLPVANLRAMGFTVDDPKPDSEILWNQFYLDGFDGGFDFDRSDGVVGADFVAVAMHEIGHALGFSSGVDDVDLVFAGWSDVTLDEINDYPVVTVLDLFRYTAESKPLIDLRPGGSPYFSSDGGATNLGEFATGANLGDGFQAGHWRVGRGGIMAPTFPDGAVHHLTRLDVQAMDVIGWDVSPSFFGDFDGDGSLTAADINALSATVRAGNNPSQFDLNLDQRVDDADRTIWVNDLKRTYFGDANFDREFNSGDLIAVFTVSKYESGVSAEWQDGDWNGDGQFGSRDFVVAFAEGGYEQGPRAASPVPEPNCAILLSICLLGLAGRWRSGWRFDNGRASMSRVYRSE